MHWRTCDLWKVGLPVAGMLLLLVFLTWVPATAATAHERGSESATPGTVTVQATPTEDATVTALNKEKLQHENDWLWNYGATVLTSVISTLTLAAAGLFTVVRYFNDRRDTREKQEAEAKRLAEDRKAERERRDEEQQRWLKDQESEREKRAEERFQAAVEGLSSERKEAKIGAAILLRTFLHPGYEQFFTQAYDLAVAHLRLGNHDSEDLGESIDSVRQALVIVLREAFPKVRKIYEERYPEEPQITRSLRFDVSHVQLDNAYLYLADLVKIRMRDASLRKANLSRAQLVESNLTRANLQRAMMVGTDLRGANLSSAKLMDVVLRDALLQGADLKYADLSGADLCGTNIADALSLKGTNLRGVKGLSKEQLEACKAKGAIIDEDTTISVSQSAVAPASPPQSNNEQSSSSPSPQENGPPSLVDTNSDVHEAKRPSARG